jgi:L-malate glycosyltransferase
VYHIQVKEGNFSFVQKQISGYEKSFVLYIPIKKWFTKELLSTLILWYVLVFKIKKKGVFAYNFHIAYPLLTYSRVLTLFIRKPIFVTEHWSAYHFNFGVKKKLKRIQRIFKNKKLRFICVSQGFGAGHNAVCRNRDKV